MCSIFGTNMQDKELLRMLGIAGLIRGSDATGVASLQLEESKINIFKEDKPANDFNWDKVLEGDFYLGHTRFTTQGTEENNYNNHPFRSNDGTFTVAHNGIIYNDKKIRKRLDIPETTIKTDSYIIVQLLQLTKYMQKKKELDVEIIKETVELLQGSYTLTIADVVSNSLYILRSGNPLYYIFDGKNFIYTSTKTMLENALSYSWMEDFPAPINKIEEDIIYEFDLLKNKFVNKLEFDSLTSYNYNNKYDEFLDIDTNKDKNDEENKDDNEEIDDTPIFKKTDNIDESYDDIIVCCPACGVYATDKEWEKNTEEFHEVAPISIKIMIENKAEEYFKCPECNGITLLNKDNCYVVNDSENSWELDEVPF